jgi:hypothetical protein
MKKGDFVEVHVYLVSGRRGIYGGGIIFTKKKFIDKNNLYNYEGLTLLKKDFFDKFVDSQDEVNFTYIE